MSLCLVHACHHLFVCVNLSIHACHYLCHLLYTIVSPCIHLCLYVYALWQSVSLPIHAFNYLFICVTLFMRVVVYSYIVILSICTCHSISMCHSVYSYVPPCLFMCATLSIHVCHCLFMGHCLFMYVTVYSCVSPLGSSGSAWAALQIQANVPPIRSQLDIPPKAKLSPQGITDTLVLSQRLAVLHAKILACA